MTHDPCAAGEAPPAKRFHPAVAAAGSDPDGAGEPHPGDEVPPGTPQSSEAICPACGGSGRANGGSCPSCDGTGQVTVLVGDA